ncbi:MAG: hypothetical protein NUV63_02990 [Gallionella sp.]|nr:hypothetical protein [Gallionella sp.]
MEPMVTKIKSRIYQDFAARLHVACDNAGLPKERGRPTELGRMIKVTYKGAGKWLEGEGMPDMGHATMLAIKLNVPFEWLMTGRSPSKIPETYLQVAEEHGHYSNLKPETVEFAKQFQRLSEKTQEQVRQFMMVQSVLNDLQHKTGAHEILARLNRQMQDMAASMKSKNKT